MAKKEIVPADTFMRRAMYTVKGYKLIDTAAQDSAVSTAVTWGVGFVATWWVVKAILYFTGFLNVDLFDPVLGA